MCLYTLRHLAVYNQVWIPLTIYHSHRFHLHSDCYPGNDPLPGTRNTRSLARSGTIRSDAPVASLGGHAAYGPGGGIRDEEVRDLGEKCRARCNPGLYRRPPVRECPRLMICYWRVKEGSASADGHRCYGAANRYSRSDMTVAFRKPRALCEGQNDLFWCGCLILASRDRACVLASICASAWCDCPEGRAIIGRYPVEAGVEQWPVAGSPREQSGREKGDSVADRPPAMGGTAHAIKL